MLVKQDESSSILQLLQLSIFTFYIIDLILQLVLQNKNKPQQNQTPLPNMA